MIKKILAVVLVLALLAGGGFWIYSRLGGGEKKMLSALEEQFSGDCALDIRYEIISGDDSALSRWLSSGKLEYTSQGDVSHILLFGGVETSPCAEAWTKNGDTVWDLGTTINWAAAGRYAVAPDLTTSLLSKVDTDITVSASQMRRFCNLIYFTCPSGSLAAEEKSFRLCTSLPGKYAKTELPENTRIYGSIRNMSFYELTANSGEKLIFGFEKDSTTVYVQKTVAGMRVEMLVTPANRSTETELVMPDTERVEALLFSLEGAKSELLESIRALPVIGKLVN